MDLGDVSGAAIGYVVYRDVLQASAKEFGAAAKERVATWADRWVRPKASRIPVEQAQLPSDRVLLTTISQVIVTPEDELQEAFAELFTKAMDKREASSIHPSFVNAVADLSSEEARILKRMWIERMTFDPSEGWTTHVESADHKFGGFCAEVVGEDLTHDFMLRRGYVWLANFRRLGLIQEVTGVESMPPPTAFPDTGLPTRLRHHLQFSVYGDAFMRACASPEVLAAREANLAWKRGR